MIALKKITKTYDFYGPRKSLLSFFFPKREQIVALNEVSLEIREGEIFGLLGPNGAGKTTLIKIICGLLKPSSGEVRLKGTEVFGAQREIGLMLGDSMVYNLMTGRDNLEYVAHLYGVTETARRIKELAEYFEIGDWIDRYVSEYSLGMRVKLCFARALIHNPSILLLDEPTLGLDPHVAVQIRNKIKTMKKTIVLTTHYMEEAELLSDRVGILHQGKVVAEGTPHELKQRLLSVENRTLTDVFIRLTTDG